MSEQRISSNLFVGRKKEFSRFQEILLPESMVNILNIHTDGDGGIGKTQMLLRMQQYCESIPDKVVFAHDLIDFYHTESLSRIGVMQQIVQNLGDENFPGFHNQFEEYRKTRDANIRETLLSKLENAFQKDYAQFAKKVHSHHKVIVLFFDTYEFIQGTSKIVSEQKQVEFREFSSWIETHLFPRISENTRLIVSGRYLLQEIDRGALTVEEMNLAHFRHSETKAFLKSCFEISTDSELYEKIGSEVLVENLCTLADGRPILLALFADWVKYEHNPLSPIDLFQSIEQKIEQNAVSDQEKKRLFEKTLIERVTSLRAPEDQAVTFMAIVHHRMTPEMFQTLTETPLEECQEILLERLKPLSFIKYQKQDIVRLHDEMRRMLIQHYWNEQDSARYVQKDIAKNVVKYYNEKLLNIKELAETDQEIYTSELLEYELIADPRRGLDQFGSKFDIALDDGRYDYCDLLLREARRYEVENLGYLPYPDRFHIRLRQIRYYTKTHQDYKGALLLAQETIEENQGKPAWEESVLSGLYLLEHGSAAFSLEQFQDAVQSFSQAKQVFYYLGEDYWQHRATNWLGYTLYRQGKFRDAEDFLKQSIDGFYRVLMYHQQKQQHPPRQLIQGLHLAIGNLAIVYGYTGSFDRAISKAEIALNITRLFQQYTMEIARAYATAGQVSLLIGDTVNAWRYFKGVQENLQETTNRIIEGRVKSDSAILQHRVNELAYLLEYYGAEKLEEFLKDQKEALSERVEQAKILVNEAITILERPPVIKKELADAYSILGGLYMFDPSPDHWQNSEIAMKKALKGERECQFLYREIDILEDLISLYYFWSGSSEVSEDQKRQNEQAKTIYQAELQQIGNSRYPDLQGKYEILLGDERFDEALKILHSQDFNQLNGAIAVLREAFVHYVAAIRLMKQFNQNLYYLALRVFYNRLRTIINEEREGKILKISDQHLGQLRTVWSKEFTELDELFRYIEYRTLSKAEIEKHVPLLHPRILEELNNGNISLASLFNACLIWLYRSLSYGEEGDKHLEEFLLHLNMQANYYHSLNDEYQARRTINIVRKESVHLKDPTLQQAIEGYTDCREGMFTYLRGEYGRLLEVFLQDDLEIGRERFDRALPGDRQKALQLLKNGEQKLREAIDFWQQQVKIADSKDERKRLENFIKKYREYLGEAQFQFGELLMLNGEFESSLNYLQEAITNSNSEVTKNTYRYDSAMQGYLHALYFSGQYDHPDYIAKRQGYEQELEKSQPQHKSIMGRLRIIQGDVLFSQFFKRVDESNGGYHYIRKGKFNIPTIRKMWHYYFEACAFMAQHRQKNFSAAVHVLQRRIQLIADADALQVIGQGLQDVWYGEKSLQDKGDELNSLIQFANIRSILLKHENAQENIIS